MRISVQDVYKNWEFPNRISGASRSVDRKDKCARLYKGTRPKTNGLGS